jgi:hypothetical protein
MEQAAYLRARRTGIPDEMIREACHWQCSDCLSTDITLEWARDRKRSVKATHYHELSCASLSDANRRGEVTAVGVG